VRGENLFLITITLSLSPLGPTARLKRSERQREKWK